MTTPVAESEVSNIQSLFERLASTVVAHSHQVREIAELRAKVDEVTNRLNSLSNESQNLRADLSSAWTAYEQCKKERDDAQAEAKVMAQDAMAARTETVNVRMEFEQKLGVANDTIDARDTRIRELEDKLYAMTTDRDDWSARSSRWEKLAKESESKLATVQGKLDDIYSMFKPKEAEPVKASSGFDELGYRTDPVRAEPQPFKATGSGW